jgi:regulator of replication initiation timing
MTQEEERAQLRAENQALREALGQAQELLEVTLARIARTGKAENVASLCESQWCLFILFRSG